MRDYIFRLELCVLKFELWFFFLIAFLLLWNFVTDHGMLDITIFIFGVTLWIGVLIETINLMLPESDEPYDWQ